MTDSASEFGRLLAERDRLISEGHDPDELLVPLPPGPPPRGIEVRVPGHPPGGNALHRMTHWQVRRTREEWRKAAYWAAVKARVDTGWSPPPTARLEVTWSFRVRRRRDFDNLVSGLKPLLDGLVGAGIIQDDDTAHLVSLGPLTVTVGGLDETILRVTAAE